MKSRSRLEAVQSGLLHAGALQLHAPLPVAGLNGRREGRRTGNALEFAGYREYQAGDDLRRLDWGVYARSEQLVVRQYREEIDPRCDLILDYSASMALPGSAKAECMLGIAALLAQASANAGFALKVWHCHGEMSPEDNPYAPLEWREVEFSGNSNPAQGLSRFAGNFQSRGVRIVLTDLLWPDEPRHFLGRLADGSCQAVVVQILGEEDQGELKPGNVLLTDIEDGGEREILLDDNVLRTYRERCTRHQELWSAACREAGVRLVTLAAAEFVRAWPLDGFFQAGILKA